MQSPRIAVWLLERFLSFEEGGDILGDLEEEFGERAATTGRRRAVARYWVEVINALPRFIYRSIIWSMIMFSTYLKFAFRTLRRQKVFSIVNIAGLSIGLAAGFLILQYVAFEFSYDRYHENAEEIYRITNDRYQDGRLIQHGVIFYPSVAKAMKDEYPEVVAYSRLAGTGLTFVANGDVGYDESGMIFADSAFFKMFSYPLLLGDAWDLLSAPNSLAISETTARRYFGDDWRSANTLGSLLRIDNRTEFTVTGVFQDVPFNSHMSFDMVGSWKSLGADAEDSWTNSNFHAYVQLQPGADPGVLEAKLTDFSRRHFNGTEVTGYREAFFLQPLTRIHLYSDYEYELWAHGNGSGVWTMIIIAGFILVIAWVNYINLSTARSGERAREVGIRKYAGAQKQQLIRQFLVETTILNMVGLALAIGLAILSGKLFNDYLGIHLESSIWENELGLAFVAIFMIGTILSGLYPALLFSSFNIVRVLRGKFSGSVRGGRIRKTLVVFQYATSFALLAGTYVVFSQLSYMTNEDLGMDIDHVVVVNGPRLASFDSTFYQSLFAVKEELARYPEIRGTGLSPRLPGNTTGRIFNIQLLSDASNQRYTASDISVDYEFLKTMGIEILAGRDFRETDHNLSFAALRSVVVNESAASLFGFAGSDEAIGEEVNFWGKDWEIVGVAENHNHQSLRLPVEPIIFTPMFFTFGDLYVRVAGEDVPGTIDRIEQVYNRYFPGNVFSYVFLDDVYNAQYEVDRRFGKLFSLFTGLGMMIAAIGLFGLSLYTTAQRTKEIGIRKVIGASTQGILGLLLKDFVLLVIAAVCVSAPLTYLAMTKWLEGYAYHIDLSWPMLVFPGLAVLAIAVLTVSFQTVRAAIADPVRSLRYE